jgi:hypothetical protein
MAYAEMVYISRTLRADPVDWLRVALRAGGTFIAVVFLDILSVRALGLVNYVVERAHQDMPPLGSWGWLQYDAGTLYTLTFFSAVPLAFLSGMPLQGGWDHTLKRVSQSIVVLYGIALSFGIACKIVGVLLSLGKDLATQLEVSR